MRTYGLGIGIFHENFAVLTFTEQGDRRLAPLLAPLGSRRFRIVMDIRRTPYALLAPTQTNQECLNLLFEVGSGGEGVLVQAFLLHSRRSLQQLQHGSKFFD